jgi:pyruvate dehydrogenase E2 component (dihydrolipoamide acetyltransferase)
VDTEKGAIEIEAFDAGVIDRLLIEPGQKTPVGTVLAMIRAPGESPGVGAVPAVGAPPPVAPRARISPAARKAAEQLQVDLDAVEGRGPGGAITVADVERVASGGRKVLTARDRPDRHTRRRGRGDGPLEA